MRKKVSIFRSFLSIQEIPKVIVHAKKYLSNFYIIPADICEDRVLNPMHFLEFCALSDSDKDKFLMFCKECKEAGINVAFIEIEGIYENTNENIKGSI